MKQQYGSNQFIVINGKMEMHARFFLIKLVRGKEQGRGETERESVRDRALLEMRDSIGNNIDC